MGALAPRRGHGKQRASRQPLAKLSCSPHLAYAFLPISRTSAVGARRSSSASTASRISSSSSGGGPLLPPPASQHARARQDVSYTGKSRKHAARVALGGRGPQGGRLSAACAGHATGVALRTAGPLPSSYHPPRLQELGGVHARRPHVSAAATRCWGRARLVARCRAMLLLLLLLLLRLLALRRRCSQGLGRWRVLVPHASRPQAGLDLADDAADGVLLAQQAQLGCEVGVDGLARHQRQCLPRHRKHLHSPGGAPAHARCRTQQTSRHGHWLCRRHVRCVPQRAGAPQGARLPCPAPGAGRSPASAA